MEDDEIYKNRKDAGLRLGTYLAARYHGPDYVVIGIPRGGVETAYYAAKVLNASLYVVVAKKLPFPGQPEYGFGAITEEDMIYVTVEAFNRLSENVISRIIEDQKIEIQRRINLYRHGNPLHDLTGKKVIIVDDGIATGATLVPVVRLCKKKGAAQVIIAAPVSGKHYDKHLNEADKVEVLMQLDRFYAVGQAYEEFGDFTDEQLLRLLNKAEQEGRLLSSIIIDKV